MTALLSKAVQRRTLLMQALLAVPAFAVFRAAPAPKPLEDEEIVEIGGWILKRSDVA